MGLIHLISEHQQLCRRSLCLHQRTFTFVFLQSIVMAVLVSLGKPYPSSICSKIPLCIELSALEKSKNKSVTARILHELFL